MREVMCEYARTLSTILGCECASSIFVLFFLIMTCSLYAV
uniref:Uncharacterized protein n=1 Tax=Anguilla anguilla TaxID=7936 RepID=A0A0E9QZS9_ANGAN